ISSLHDVHKALLPLHVLAERFQNEVKKITKDGLSENASLQLSERVLKAKKYFTKEMEEKVIEPLLRINKELQQQNKVRKVLKVMKGLMDTFEHFVLRYSADGIKHGTEKIIFKAGLNGEVAGDEYSSENLFILLKQLRTQLALKENLPPYRICNDATLKEIAAYLPQTLNEMASIKGMGDFTLHKYGELFSESVKTYCDKNGLKGKMHLKKEPPRIHKTKHTRAIENSSPGIHKTAGPNSQRQSFELFQSGKSISEIAQIRNFSEGTIAAHLVHFIKSGEIDVYRLVSEEKFHLIQNALETVTAPGLSAVKILLGDGVSYSEIRFVIAAIDHEKGIL
ncbi:MAG: helix-turn-helix domain-containing protein, partial [Chitinophagales bacterium]|nr:helix-turn-helix domain-containing protein [Chitinophagales bacterium]